MIIQCENCSRKFVVKDSDIPKEGRMVQCSNCSQKWLQAPERIQTTSKSNINEKVSKIEFEASDGRIYRFMGSQWAELLRSGKTGLLAKRTIAAELNRRAGIAQPKKSRKKIKITEIDPSIVSTSVEKIDEESNQKKGVGFFGYIFLMIIIGFSLVGVLKTFEDDLLNYFPKTEYLFIMLNEQLEYLAESVKNLIVIIDDLIKSY